MRIQLLFLCVLPFLAAATDIPEKDWEYKRLDDDHVAIYNTDQSRRSSAIDQETEGDIVVPTTLRSMQVVSIGEKAFYGCSKLTSVTIPEGVTNIADNAFYGCSSLTNVVFPTSLKSVGKDAFYRCTKLAKAQMSGASLAIGEHAFIGCSELGEVRFSGDSITVCEATFSGCTKLREVSFDAKVISIGKGAFAYFYYSTYSSGFSACTSLTNVVLAGSTSVNIGQDAFARCTKLGEVHVPGPVLTIGDHAFIGCLELGEIRFSGDAMTVCEAAFSGCAQLRDVSFDAKVVSIGKGAFAYFYYSTYSSGFSACTSLSSAVIVATNSASIGESAFSSCTSLSNAVIVATNSASIGESAFSSCSKLRIVELPEALTEVSQKVFYKCSALESIAFSTNVAHISYQAFDTCSSLKSIGFSEGLTGIDAQAFYGCASVANLVFPQSLKNVGDRAFEMCTGLAEVRFSEGNTNLVAAKTVSIGACSFYRCGSITNVILSQAVSSMGSRVFSQCESLASVNLPTNFTDVAESAFEDCVSLERIDFPDTLKSIGNTAFFGCTNLTGFLIPTKKVVTLGAKAFKNTKFWNEYPGDLVVNNGYILGFKGTPTDVTLPKECKAIPVAMFEGMTTLKSVTIPDSVTEIGSRAFNGCSGITNLAFASVTTIGNSAFEGCTALAAISLSDVLTAIPGNCFKDCASLTEVFIPNTVASVGEYAFYSCVSLVRVAGGTEVTQVGDYAFAQCPLLQPFEFPKDVTYGDHVFQGCTWTEHVLFPTVGTLKDEYPETYMNIRSVVFSSGLSTITNGACAGCTSLQSVRIPEGVRSIGDSAFAGCASLTSVVIRCADAAVGQDPFAGCLAVKTLATATSLCLSNVFPKVYKAFSSIELLEGMTEVVDSAFEGCVALTSLKLPSTLTSIGDSAFAGCVGLSPTIIIPAAVTTLGDSAFQGCTGLTQVNFFGNSPTKKGGGSFTNLYAGTRESLRTGVLKDKKASWGGVAPAENPAALFWPALPKSGGRRLVVWPPTDEEFRAYGMMTFYYYDQTGRSDITLAGDGLLVEPTREKYTFTGWYSEPYAGVRVTEDNASAFVTAYAHWAWGDAEDGDDESEEEGEPSVVVYDFSRANKYIGSVLDGETVVGNVQVSFAKGKTDRRTGVKTASATAKVQLLGESQLSMKGTLGEDGSAELTVSRSLRTMDVEISADDIDCLTGSIDGYEVVAYRDVFSSTLAEDKARANKFLDKIKGKYVAVLSAEGDTALTCGFAALSVNVATKGSIKVSGVMPDGTSASASAQLALTTTDDGSEVGCATVVVPMYSKKGGFVFMLTFEEGIPSLVGVSDWIADNLGTVAPLFGEGVQPVAGLMSGDHVFMADVSLLQIEGVEIEEALSPDGTAFSATEKKWTLPKADTVKFVKDEGYVIKKDNGNPAALKLSYTTSTGLFSGSFKVYGITEAGRSKTYTATVRGGVLDGVGFGTAVIKKVGSVPVGVE